MTTNKPFYGNSVIHSRPWYRNQNGSGSKMDKEIVKTTFVIGLLILYSVTAIGVTVHFHYCMDRFAGWSLWDTDDQKCPKCGMHEHKEGCCSDVHKQIKLSDDYQKTSYALKPVLIDQGYSVPIVSVEQSFVPSTVLPFQVSPDPPLLFRPRLHLQHCVFLI